MFQTNVLNTRRLAFSTLLLIGAALGTTATQAADYHYGGYKGFHASKNYLGKKSLNYGYKSQGYYGAGRSVDSRSYYSRRPTSSGLKYGYYGSYRGGSHFRH